MYRMLFLLKHRKYFIHISSIMGHEVDCPPRQSKIVPYMSKNPRCSHSTLYLREGYMTNLKKKNNNNKHK